MYPPLCHMCVAAPVYPPAALILPRSRCTREYAKA